MLKSLMEARRSTFESKAVTLSFNMREISKSPQVNDAHELVTWKRFNFIVIDLIGDLLRRQAQLNVLSKEPHGASGTLGREIRADHKSPDGCDGSKGEMARSIVNCTVPEVQVQLGDVCVRLVTGNDVVFDVEHLLQLGGPEVLGDRGVVLEGRELHADREFDPLQHEVRVGFDLHRQRKHFSLLGPATVAES